MTEVWVKQGRSGGLLVPIPTALVRERKWRLRALFRGSRSTALEEAGLRQPGESWPLRGQPWPELSGQLMVCQTCPEHHPVGFSPGMERDSLRPERFTAFRRRPVLHGASCAAIAGPQDAVIDEAHLQPENTSFLPGESQQPRQQQQPQQAAQPQQQPQQPVPVGLRRSYQESFGDTGPNDDPAPPPKRRCVAGWRHVGSRHVASVPPENGVLWPGISMSEELGIGCRRTGNLVAGNAPASVRPQGRDWNGADVVRMIQDQQGRTAAQGGTDHAPEPYWSDARNCYRASPRFQIWLLEDRPGENILCLSTAEERARAWGQQSERAALASAARCIGHDAACKAFGWGEFYGERVVRRTHLPGHLVADLSPADIPPWVWDAAVRARSREEGWLSVQSNSPPWPQPGSWYRAEPLAAGETEAALMEIFQTAALHWRRVPFEEKES